MEKYPTNTISSVKYIFMASSNYFCVQLFGIGLLALCVVLLGLASPVLTEAVICAEWLDVGSVLSHIQRS